MKKLKIVECVPPIEGVLVSRVAIGAIKDLDEYFKSEPGKLTENGMSDSAYYGTLAVMPNTLVLKTSTLETEKGNIACLQILGQSLCILASEQVFRECRHEELINKMLVDMMLPNKKKEMK